MNTNNAIPDAVVIKRPVITENRLSPREIEVLAYLHLGYTSREIGDKFGIASRTVDTHRENILQKMREECHPGRRKNLGVAHLVHYMLANHAIIHAAYVAAKKGAADLIVEDTLRRP